MRTNGPWSSTLNQFPQHFSDLENAYPHLKYNGYSQSIMFDGTTIAKLLVLTMAAQERLTYLENSFYDLEVVIDGMHARMQATYDIAKAAPFAEENPITKAILDALKPVVRNP